MAEDFAEKRKTMMARWDKEHAEILNKLTWAPFTTGKFTYNEIMSVIERDYDALNSAKPTDYEVFVPYSNIKNKFKKELKEVDELMAEFGPSGQASAREAYLKRNQVPEDDLARMINPYYLYDPDDDEDEEE